MQHIAGGIDAPDNRFREAKAEQPAALIAFVDCS
jgi:hypothetical protein